MQDTVSTPIAFTRDVSPLLGRCQLTHLDRRTVDVERAAEQHRAYERCLESLGCRVVRAAPVPACPDSVFIEDTAVILDGLAVITRPGAPSRRAETRGVAELLGNHLPLRELEEPATLDGGDVLPIGRRLFVGMSARTNEAGVEQLASLAEPLGYRVTPVPISGCLHLKTAVTEVGDGVLLANPSWVNLGSFAELEVLTADPQEPFAANGLRIGTALVYPSAYPRTRELLKRQGLGVTTVDLSELAKAEGAVTCCSLILDSSSSR